MDVPTIVVILGAALLVIAISGGGITFKEVSFPKVSNRLRFILAPLGILLVILGVILWIKPGWLTAPPATETPASLSTSTSASAPDPAVEPAKAPDAVCDEFDTYAFGWPTENQLNDVVVEQAHGQFRIAYYKPGEGFSASWSPGQYTDFTVETLFSTPADAKGAAGGLTLRTLEKRWYLFWVYPESKTYVFIKDVNGLSEYLAGPARLEGVEPLQDGDRFSVQVKIVAMGSRFEIWVAPPGGTYVLQAIVEDDTLAKGHLGPSAPRPTFVGQSPVETRFEWVCISQP